MSKYLRKIGALLIAVVMVLAMCIPAYADGNTPKESDKAAITVEGAESDLTVTAYQIVKAEYNDVGFIGYNAVTDNNGNELVADVTAPTADEITAIAKKINDAEDNSLGTLKSVQLTGTNGTYSAQAEAGSWLVIITGGKGLRIYNPMLLSVNYTVSGSDNTMEGGTVDASSNWSLNGTVAYAKSSEPTIDKKIENPGSENSKGDDVAIGDTVTFKVEAEIPTYTDQYKNIIFKIEDTLSAGLTGKKDASVLVGGNALDMTKASLEQSEGGFTLTINDDEYLINNAGKQIVITYSATLNENAGINFAANPNTVKLTYSNDPSDASSKQEIEKKTYHYTFGIDALINGENSERTDELFKTESGGSVEVTGEEVTVTNPLEGAKFGLYKEGVANPIREATSGEDGAMTFEGLDAGEYYLQEITAPEGYTLSSVKTPVKISATYNEDGTLKEYSIKIGEEATSIYTATYDGGINVSKTQVQPTNIPNTRLSELPSTGGIGTYLFTIVGVVLMAAAAGLIFIKRRRSE